MRIFRRWISFKFALLIFLLVLSILLAVYHNEQPVSSSPLGRLALTVLSPPLVVLRWIDVQIEGAYDWIFSTSQMREDYTELKKEYVGLKEEYRQLFEAHQSLVRKTDLATFVKTQPTQLLPATILGFSPHIWTKTIILDRGNSHGVRVKMPVINREGLVGIIRETTEAKSVAQLIIDPSMAVGSIIKDTRDQGIVEGTGSMDTLRFVFELSPQRMNVDGDVITSGLENSIYPKGLVIGRIALMKKDKFGKSFAVVRPAVSFSKLEDVLILLKTAPEE